MVQSKMISAEVGEAALNLLGILENSEIHHDRPRFLSKEETHEILRGVYELAHALVKANSD